MRAFGPPPCDVCGLPAAVEYGWFTPEDEGTVALCAVHRGEWFGEGTW